MKHLQLIIDVKFGWRTKGSAGCTETSSEIIGVKLS